MASDSSSNSSSSSSSDSEGTDSEDDDSGQESITAKKKRRKSDNESARNRKVIRRDVSGVWHNQTGNDVMLLQSTESWVQNQRAAAAVLPPATS